MPVPDIQADGRQTDEQTDEHHATFNGTILRTHRALNASRAKKYDESHLLMEQAYKPDVKRSVLVH